MKKIAIALILLCVLWSNAIAQDITLSDTLWLRKATHINNTLGKWDTLFARIMHGNVEVADVMMIDAGDAGRWSGFYVPTYKGNFVAEYNAVYSGDTIVEEQYFTVLDTAAFFGTAGGSGLDSATTSRIIGRKVWGLAEEGGNDSSTWTERTVVATAVVDTAAIARSVWDDDIVSQANRTVTASCAGSGARTVIIWIKDITDSTGIAGFEIDIEDSVGGGGVYNNTTNSSGCCTLSLDDATWTIHLQKVPYSITSPVYVTISGNTTLTYYATPFTPSSPPGDSLCVVYGYVKKSNGDPYVGAKVEIWMDAYPVTFGGILIDVVTKQVVYTNILGRFEFSDGIYYSSSLNPSTLKWKIRVKTTNWVWSGSVTVPSQASWEIEIPDQ